MTTAENTTQQTALDTALGYFNAWTARDVDASMRFVADDVVFDAPFGRAEGAQALRASLENFLGILKSAELVEAFANENGAVIVYIAETTRAGLAPACEYFGIEDGQITYKRLIFDRSPFVAAG